MGQNQSVDYAVVVENETIGAVTLRDSDTLADARREIYEDGIPAPTDYQFVLPNGAPVSSTQERKRSVSDSATDGDKIILKGGILDEIRECLGPIHHLDDSLIAEQAQLFTEGTRQWVFDKFDDWVSSGPENPHRVFVLAGQAGIGKTGIMCKLARDRQDVVVARHFCRHDDSRRKNPRAMLLSLSYQLAVAFPEYCRRLGAHIKQHKLTRSKLMGNEYDTISLFAELFQNLLGDLGAGAEMKRHVILIDAIDECEHSCGSRNGILDCIRKYFKNLPCWLGVFITTRPELPIKEKLKQFNPIEIEPNMEDNLTDLRIFFTAFFEEACIRRRLKFVNKAQAVETLLDKSRGLFIYAVMTADAVRSGEGPITQGMLDDFPDGLDGFYQEQMERAFPNTERSLSWDVVKLVIAAAEPLHIEFVEKLTDCTEDQRKNAIQELSLFFPVQGHRIQLYHKSLKDWLVSDERSESRYHIKLDEVERRLAQGCLRILRETGVVSGQKAGIRPSVCPWRYEVVVQYPLRHCVEHLCSVAMQEQAKGLVLDVGWLVARAESEDSLGIIQDCRMLGDGDRVVELLGRAVSLSQNALRRDPRQLASQLVGRLTGPASSGGGENVEVRQALNNLVERLKLYDYGWSWWCPVTSTWDQANTTCLRLLVGHSGSVRCVRWSKDGKWIVSGSSDSQIRIWDANSGECIQVFKEAAGKVNTVSLSTDGTQIAAAYNQAGGKLHVFDTSTGECRQLLGCRRMFQVRSVAWSPDNLYLSAGSGRKIGICDVSTGELVNEVKIDRKVFSVAWAHNSDWLSAAVENRIWIFDVAVDKKLKKQLVLEGHTDRVNTVAWSNDDTQILSGSEDWTIRIWNTITGECLQILKGKMAEWSYDCKKVMSALKHHAVALWDLKTGENTHMLRGHTGPVLGLAWSPDGSQVVSSGADHTIRVWDITSGVSMQRNEGHLGYITSHSWSRKGKYLVTASVDRTLIVWDASTGKVIHVLTGHNGRVACVACSNVVNGDELIASGSQDRSVRVWKLLSAACLHELKGHTNAVKSVAWSNHDSLLASGSVDGIRLWDSTKGICLKVLSNERSNTNISLLAWSPDGKCLASASTDSAITFWDVAQGKPTLHRPGEAESLWFLAYSDDGKHIMSSFRSNSASIINALSGECTQICDHSDIRPKLSQMRFSSAMNSGSLQILGVDSVGVATNRFHEFGNRACSVTGDTAQFFTLFERHRSRPEGNKIIFLQSDPLVFKDAASGMLQPMPRLAFTRERELMRQCLVDASRDIKLSFGAATTKTLQDAVINKAELLHFSGHGAPTYLFVEDGMGGAHFLDGSMLEELYPHQHGTGQTIPPHKLVFISACYSGYLAKVFVDAGVGHVVCCQHDAVLADEAANIFMKSFYMALAVGHTVKVSFEMGRQAVVSGPFLLNASREKEKFVLLPDNVNHDEAIIFARPVTEWAGGMVPLQWLPSTADIGSEWQVDMFMLLHKVLQHKFVTLVGMGADVRLSLATATCHYISDRRSTTEIDIDVVLCVQLFQQKDAAQSLAASLYQQLVSAGKAQPLIDNSLQQDTKQKLISSLQKTKALLLVVEDHNSSGFDSFLAELLQMISQLKVLRTADEPTMDSQLSLYEELYELEPSEKY